MLDLNSTWYLEGNFKLADRCFKLLDKNLLHSVSMLSDDLVVTGSWRLTETELSIELPEENYILSLKDDLITGNGRQKKKSGKVTLTKLPDDPAQIMANTDWTLPTFYGKNTLIRFLKDGVLQMLNAKRESIPGDYHWHSKGRFVVFVLGDKSEIKCNLIKRSTGNYRLEGKNLKADAWTNSFWASQTTFDTLSKVLNGFWELHTFGYKKSNNKPVWKFLPDFTVIEQTQVNSIFSNKRGDWKFDERGNVLVNFYSDVTFDIYYFKQEQIGGCIRVRGDETFFHLIPVDIPLETVSSTPDTYDWENEQTKLVGVDQVWVTNATQIELEVKLGKREFIAINGRPFRKVRERLIYHISYDCAFALKDYVVKGEIIALNSGVIKGEYSNHLRLCKACYQGVFNPCQRCGGSGEKPEYWYYMGGVCFGCDGSGIAK